MSTFSDHTKLDEFFTNLGIELGFHIYLAKDYPNLRTHICNRTIEERTTKDTEHPIIVVLYDDYWETSGYELGLKKQSIRCNLIHFNKAGEVKAVYFKEKETVQDLIDFLRRTQEEIKTIQVKKKKNEIDKDFQ